MRIAAIALGLCLAATAACKSGEKSREPEPPLANLPGTSIAPSVAASPPSPTAPTPVSSASIAPRRASPPGTSPASTASTKAPKSRLAAEPDF